MKATQKRSKKSSDSIIRKHLKHVLVPHKGNQYRPHLVRLHGITVILGLAILMQFGYSFLTSGRLEVLGRVSDISVSNLVSDTNVEREKASLPDLKTNDQLTSAAFAKAKDMFANNYWAHVSPSGVTPWKWIGDAGYNYTVAGENLAKNYPTAQATLNAWMGSTTHRENILNPQYQDVGFAVVDGILDGQNTTLIVAYYGASATKAAIQGATNTKTPIVNAAPVEKGIGNPLAYFGRALQSMSPATLGALALLAIISVVAIAAHHYRQKLPEAWRRTWRMHHGLYTFIGVLILAVAVVFASGGGQI